MEEKEGPSDRFLKKLFAAQQGGNKTRALPLKEKGGTIVKKNQKTFGYCLYPGKKPSDSGRKVLNLMRDRGRPINKYLLMPGNMKKRKNKRGLSKRGATRHRLETKGGQSRTNR